MKTARVVLMVVGASFQVGCAAKSPEPAAPTPVVAPKPKGSPEADAQWQASAAAKQANDLSTALAAAETAMLLETNPQRARELIRLRLQRFAQSPALPSDTERSTLTYQAQWLSTVEQDPASKSAALMALSKVRRLSNDAAGALSALEQAATGTPTADALVALAAEYIGAKRWPEASKTYERALQLDQRRPEVLSNYGYTLMQQGELEKAENFLMGASQLVHSPALALQLAELLDRKLKRDDAIVVLERPVDPGSDPELVNAMRRRLGWLYLETGKLDAAQTVLSAEVKETSSAEGQVALAEVARLKGDAAKAQALLTKVVTPPETPRCLFAALMVAVDGKKPKVAKQLAERYVRVAMTDPREGARLTQLQALERRAYAPAK